MAQTRLQIVLSWVGAWLALTITVTVLLAIVPWLAGGFDQGFWVNVVCVAGMTVFGAIVSVGLVYLIHVGKSARGLNLPSSEISATEVVLREVMGTHYQRVWGFNLAIGGKVYLTSSYLIFKGHAGQPGVKEIAIPLSDVVAARSVPILAFKRGFLVERTDGQQDKFNLILGSGSVEEWVSAILVVRGMGPTIEGRDGTNVPTLDLVGDSGAFKGSGPGEIQE